MVKGDKKTLKHGQNKTASVSGTVKYGVDKTEIDTDKVAKKYAEVLREPKHKKISVEKPQVSEVG